MAAIATPAPGKLPVWSTVGACYATVARNLGQLVRISWLWLLIMVPVYAVAHWLALRNWDWPQEQAMKGGVSQLIALLPFVVELPFLASIAVAWHRLILRRERVTQPAYLRLDKTVWLYALYSFAFLVLMQGPPTGFLILAPETPLTAVLWLVAIIVLALAIGLLMLPRLSLVLPAVAVGERLSLGQAWRMSRGNTLRLALATCLCVLPAAFTLLLPLLFLSLFLRVSADADGISQLLDGFDQLLGSLVYAVVNSIGYAVLVIFAVTLLSLTYAFFAAPHDENH
jgi:hypothetical protein